MGRSGPRASASGTLLDIRSGREMHSMPTPAKAAIIDEMTEKLKQSRAAVLLQTEGLTVAEMQELRRRLRAAGVELYSRQEHAAAHRFRARVLSAICPAFLRAHLHRSQRRG